MIGEQLTTATSRRTECSGSR